MTHRAAGAALLLLAACTTHVRAGDPAAPALPLRAKIAAEPALGDAA